MFLFGSFFFPRWFGSNRMRGGGEEGFFLNRNYTVEWWPEKGGVGWVTLGSRSYPNEWANTHTHRQTQNKNPKIKSFWWLISPFDYLKIVIVVGCVCLSLSLSLSIERRNRKVPVSRQWKCRVQLSKPIHTAVRIIAIVGFLLLKKGKSLKKEIGFERLNG
jgi:hypothetical protein